VDGRIKWLGVDQSTRQLADCPHRPVIRANAVQLPLANQSFDAVVLLSMLYHLDDPRLALAEAWRVVRPGLVAACASNRTNDPELVPDGYPRTAFDGEEAARIVTEVCGAAHMWDVHVIGSVTPDIALSVARSLVASECEAANVGPLSSFGDGEMGGAAPRPGSELGRLDTDPVSAHTEKAYKQVALSTAIALRRFFRYCSQGCRGVVVRETHSAGRILKPGVLDVPAVSYSLIGF
jgi:SAM-dependent methyltransferase